MYCQRVTREKSAKVANKFPNQEPIYPVSGYSHSPEPQEIAFPQDRTSRPGASYVQQRKVVEPKGDLVIHVRLYKSA